MILADTSAWVEYDRATGSDLDTMLTDLISAGGRGLAVTEPVLMEVLAGARDERRQRDLRQLLTSFSWIPADLAADFEGAARIYRSCRAAGVTPRGLVDCMIGEHRDPVGHDAAGRGRRLPPHGGGCAASHPASANGVGIDAGKPGPHPRRPRR